MRHLKKFVYYVLDFLGNQGVRTKMFRNKGAFSCARMSFRGSLLMAAIVILLAIALYRLDFRSVVQSIGHVSAWFFLLLIVMQVGTQLIINLSWYKIAHIVRAPITYWDMLYVNCQGAIMDAITPGVKFGGEATRAVQLKKIFERNAEQLSDNVQCSGYEDAASIIAMHKFFSLSILSVMVLVAVGGIAGYVPWPGHVQWLIYAGVCVYLVVFVIIFVIPHKVRALFLHADDSGTNSRLLYVQNFVCKLLAHVSQLHKNKKTTAGLFSLSIFTWIFYPFKMYILVLQFYPDVSFAHIMGIAFAAYIVGMLPIFPGGLGGFEPTMVALLLASTGMEVTDAVAVTIIFRFVTFWFVMLFGMVYVAVYKGCSKVKML